MSDKNRSVPGLDHRGYRPATVGDGYKPMPGPVPSGAGKPGAGHQPAPGGPRPPLPTVGTGVKPPPKKD